MKNIFKLFAAAIVLAGTLTACGGDDDAPDVKLELSADKYTIEADGVQEVVFTVKFNGEVVTDLSEIKVGTTTLEGNTWVATETGTFKFTARYEGNVSNEVSIRATEPDGPLPLVLTADDDFIRQDGEVTFTVKQGGVVVTGRCTVEIVGGDALSSNVFEPEQWGEYEFRAYFTENPGGQKSPKVKVNVRPVVAQSATFDAGRPLHRSVLFVTSTATWCAPCLTLKNYIKAIDQYLGDCIIPVSLYCDNRPYKPIVQGPDIIATIENFKTNRLNNDFDYPYTVLDMDVVGGVIIGYETEKLLSDEAVEFGAKPAKAALKVESAISGSSVDLMVTVGAKDAGTYQLGAFLIEDNIVGYQEAYGSSYSHMNVIRDMATSDVLGDALPAIAAGGTQSKNLSFDILPEYKTQNLRLVVYVLSKVGVGASWTVTNSLEASVNGTTGFTYDTTAKYN